MLFQYFCRYCNQRLGKLDVSSLTEAQLGLDKLTPDERADIISVDSDGHSKVNVICELCQESLENNPELLLVSYLIQ